MFGAAVIPSMATSWADLSAAASIALADAVESRNDGLLQLHPDETAEIFHLTCRQFNLNGNIHRLYLFKRLTRELARREVETWKKVIRLITHELNNSLAPLQSLNESARKIRDRGKGEGQLQDIYESMGRRMAHLQDFIEQYAKFARLPSPKPREVNWMDFIGQLAQLVPFSACR